MQRRCFNPRAGEVGRNIDPFEKREIEDDLSHRQSIETRPMKRLDFNAGRPLESTR